MNAETKKKGTKHQRPELVIEQILPDSPTADEHPEQDRNSDKEDVKPLKRQHILVSLRFPVFDTLHGEMLTRCVCIGTNRNDKKENEKHYRQHQNPVDEFFL